MNYLTSKVPTDKTLTESYESHIVPHLRQIVDGQNRTYKNIDVRRIKIEQWHEYLILKKFRSRRRG